MVSDSQQPARLERGPADWTLVALTWCPAVAMIGLYVVDIFCRFVLGAPIDFDNVDRLLRLFGYMLLAAVFIGAALTVADWRRGRRRDLTSLVVWPGLPVAAALAALGLVVLIFKMRSLGAPIAMLANPLAAHSHAAIFMITVVGAVAFGSYDRRLTCVAAAPIALLMLPYLAADISISGGVMAQIKMLISMAIIGAIAAIASRRMWPAVAASGAGIFVFVFPPLLIGLFTPTEAFAALSVLAALPALIVALVKWGKAGLVAALHSGARETAGIAAVIACASVVPMLLNTLGFSLVRGDVLAKVPGAPLIVLACLTFVALAVVMTPLLTIALVGALGVVGAISGPLQGLQAATLAATVPLGLAAMSLREALAARATPADALLPERMAQALALVLLAVGCGAALFLGRTVSLT